MATWNTPPTHVTGDTISVTDWNTIANNETFLYQRPYALYYNSVGTSVASGATTQVTLGGTTAANYGFSVSSNNVIVPITGVYQVMFSVQMSSAAGSGGNTIWANGFHNSSNAITGSTVPSYMQGGAQSFGGGLMLCNAGDTISLRLSNLSGSTLTTQPGVAQTYMHVVFVGSN